MNKKLGIIKPRENISNDKKLSESQEIYNQMICGLEYDFFTKNDYLKPAKYAHKKPYRMTIFFGIPGSGKSTMAAKLAQKSLRNGVPVFSNLPISGAYQIDRFDLGKYEIDHATIIIDEAAVDYSNRSYSDKDYKKNFGETVNRFLRYFRHFQCDVYVFSQSYNDMDVNFRRLAYDFYVMKKTFPIFPIPMFTAVRIKRRIGVNEDTKQIDDIYEEPNPKILGLFLNKRVWGPRYFKYFNTYSHEKLPTKDWELW